MKKNTPLLARTRTLLLASLIAAGSVASCGKTNFTDIEHIARAKDFQDQGDLTASVIELKGALKKNPENAEARWLLGQIYVDLENGAAAEKELMRARGLGIDPSAVIVPLGKSLLMQGKAQQVLDEINVQGNTPAPLRTAILTLRAEAQLDLKQLDPAQADLTLALETCGTNKCPETLLALSSLERSRNNPSKAKEWVMKAVAQDPNNSVIWRYLGNLEKLQDHPEDALKAYDKAIQLNARDIHALFERSLIRLDTGNVNGSKADADLMRKVAPTHITLHYLDGRHAFVRENYAQAQTSFESYLKANPNYHIATYYLALTHVAQKHWQQAGDQLARLLSMFPTSLQLRKTLAFVQLQRNAPDDAIKTLKAVTAKQDTNDVGVVKLLGQAFIRKGDLQTGLGYLQQVVDIEPASAAARLDLGRALQQVQGKTELALEQFEAALKIKPDLTEAQTLRILTYLQAKQFDAALLAIATLQNKLPKNPVPANLAAAAYIGKKDYAKARQSFEKALVLDPKYLAAHVGLAQVALLQNNPAAARKHYQDVLDKEPGHLLSLLALADLDTRTGKPQEAIAWLEEARQKHPDALDPALLLVGAYLRQKESLKALGIARDIQRTYPEHPGALQALGQAQLAAGEINSALSTFRNMTEKLPKSPQAHYLLAITQITANDVKAATATLNKVLKLDPRFIFATVTLSDLELKNNRPQEALRIARQLQQQQPQAPAGYEIEGNIHMYKQAYPEAAKAYANAAKWSKNGELVRKLANARKQAGDLTGAHQALTQWLTANPDDLQSRITLAALFQSEEKYTESLQQYQKVLEKQPKNAIVLNNLAWIYHEQNDPRALEYAEKAYKGGSDQAAFIDTYGWMLVQKGQTDRGLELLRQALNKAPAIPSIRYHLAFALDKTGQKQEARKELENLLAKEKKFPETQQAKELLTRLQSAP